MIDGRRTIERVIEALEETGLPCEYSHFDEKVNPPFLVYYGAGQVTQSADDTHFWSHNIYNLEYYFTKKESRKEEELEAILLDAGFQFTKSEDIYIDDEDVFVIYYYLN